jgi:hypothetical protein
MITKKHYMLDNVFSQEDIKLFYDTLIKYKFTDEHDYPDLPTSGAAHHFNEDDLIYKQLLEKTGNLFEELKELKPYAAYVNLFKPKEDTFYHRDEENDSPNDGLTVIYYITPDFDLNEGGETLFYNEFSGVLLGVTPKSGRVVEFDSTILHKATPFKTKSRITAVLKYKFDKKDK